MDKIAEQVKKAEVNGFVAGLVDTGILKVANDEELAIVADVIAENLPEDYTMEDAMAVAAEVVDALEGGEGMTDEEAAALAAAEAEGTGEGMVVEASDKDEVNVTAAMAALGELSMAKEAGDISEEDFKKEAAPIQQMIRSVKRLPGNLAAKASAAKGNYADALTGNKKRIAFLENRARKSSGKQLHNIGQQLRDARKATTRARVGTAAAGAGTTAVGGKALYDKYNQ
jgi:hypothetical protein